MTKYRVEMIYPSGETELEDYVFDSREEAEEHGLYMCSCYSQGGEDLHMSNPGDYPNSGDGADFRIIEID